jgi:hypothetical protein
MSNVLVNGGPQSSVADVPEFAARPFDLKLESVTSPDEQRREQCRQKEAQQQA